jgi:hypothetical protein
VTEPVVSRQTVSKSERPDQNRGPFATKPEIESQYHDDAALKRVLECKLFLFSSEKITHAPQIVRLPRTIYFLAARSLETGAKDAISRRVLDWCSDAERNRPHIQHWGLGAKLKAN